MFLSGDAIAVVEVASWTFTCDPRENIIIAFSFCCLQQLFIDSLYLLHFPHHKRSLNSRRPNSTKVSNRQYLKEKALLRSTVREIARLTWGWSKSSLIFRFTNPSTLKLIIRRRKRLLKTFPKANRPKSMRKSYSSNTSLRVERETDGYIMGSFGNAFQDMCDRWILIISTLLNWNKFVHSITCSKTRY